MGTLKKSGVQNGETIKIQMTQALLGGLWIDYWSQLPMRLNFK